MSGFKKILVTGAAGMLGSQFLKLFSKNEFEIYSLDLVKTNLISEKRQFIGNLTEDNVIQNVLSTVEPDFIIHAAAIVNLNLCEENRELAYNVHVKATQQLAKYRKAKLIYISTDSVFDGNKGNYTEADKTNPLNYYAESKLSGEMAAAENPDSIIVRTNIFGFNPILKKSFAEWAITNFKQNELITGFSDVRFNALYTSDLSLLILQLIKKEFRGTINLASKDSMSKYEFLVYLAEKLNYSKRLVIKGKSSDMNFNIARPLNTTLDISKAKEFVELPTMQEEISKFVNDFILIK